MRKAVSQVSEVLGISDQQDNFEELIKSVEVEPLN